MASMKESLRDKHSKHLEGSYSRYPIRSVPKLVLMPFQGDVGAGNCLDLIGKWSCIDVTRGGRAGLDMVPSPSVLPQTSASAGILPPIPSERGIETATPHAKKS